ncbi:MAG: hypothetical protein RR718_13440, partial [Comamonas sp.]
QMRYQAALRSEAINVTWKTADFFKIANLFTQKRRPSRGTSTASDGSTACCRLPFRKKSG